MTRYKKGSNGQYQINGRSYEKLIGSRAQVYHGTAYKTKYGLKKDNLLYNKHGRIVSRIKHNTAKREKRLEKHGYFTKKGKFGYVKRDGSTKRRGRKSRKGRKGRKH